MARPQSVASELLGSALSSACTWSAKRPDRPTGVGRSPSRRTDAVSAVSGQASAPSNGSASAQTTGTGGRCTRRQGTSTCAPLRSWWWRPTSMAYPRAASMTSSRWQARTRGVRTTRTPGSTRA